MMGAVVFDKFGRPVPSQLVLQGLGEASATSSSWGTFFLGGILGFFAGMAVAVVVEENVQQAAHTRRMRK